MSTLAFKQQPERTQKAEVFGTKQRTPRSCVPLPPFPPSPLRNPCKGLTCLRPLYEGMEVSDVYTPPPPPPLSTPCSSVALPFLSQPSDACCKWSDVFTCRPDWTPQEAAVRQGPDYEEVDPKDLGEAAHFCRFAFAAYGYMLYIWSRPQMV